jgi:hypothetical protein
MRPGVVAAMLCLLSASAFAACGEKGGPGYRGPDGRCVGWSAIGRVCGNPPTQRCTAERANTNAGVAADHGSKIMQMMGEAHDRVKRNGQ